jgi:gluconate 5-dehydrogenase
VEAGQKIAESLGDNSMYVQADISDKDACLRLIDETLKRFGKLDILINNAGATWGAPAEDHPVEAWDKVMDLNVRSIFLLSQSIGKLSMIPRNYGRIVNIASIAGLAGNGANMQTLAYNTSKAAVINFTRTLAGEWGKYGITVNAIAPGFFPSKMSRGLLETMGEDAIQRAPLRRLGDDEDLKGAVVLFSSAAGKHITGQTLAIDGGVSAVII